MSVSAVKTATSAFRNLSPVASVGIGAALTSAFFCVKNVEKTLDGHVGRSGVAAGQAKNLIHNIEQIDNAVGKTTKTAVDALKLSAKSDKLLSGTYKVLDFASKNVNKFIVGSAALDVALSEDKEKAIYSNAGAIATMFAFENAIKSKTFKNSKAVAKVSTKMDDVAKAIHCTKLPPVLKAVAFIACDMAAYDLGDKVFGDLLLGKVRASRGEKQDTPAQTENANETVRTYNA